MNRRAKGLKSSSRNENTRTENTKNTGDRYISFSFRYFIDIDDIGQSIQTWHQEGLLLAFYEKLQHISTTGITTLMQNGVITNYRRFPEDSGFKIPQGLDASWDWSVIKDIGGQKVRVAGFLENNIFHIVYLDKDHQFWPSKR